MSYGSQAAFQFINGYVINQRWNIYGGSSESLSARGLFGLSANIRFGFLGALLVVLFGPCIALYDRFAERRSDRRKGSVSDGGVWGGVSGDTKLMRQEEKHASPFVSILCFCTVIL
jgi:hypothetical protein